MSRLRANMKGVWTYSALGTVLGLSLVSGIGLPSSAQAQSTAPASSPASGGVWSLPEPSASPSNTRIQGPVDNQHPTIRSADRKAPVETQDLPTASTPRNATQPTPAPPSLTQPRQAPANDNASKPKTTPTEERSAPRYTGQGKPSPAIVPLNSPISPPTPRPALLREVEATQPAAAPSTPAPSSPAPALTPTETAPAFVPVSPSSSASEENTPLTDPAQAPAESTDLDIAAQESWPFWWLALPLAGVLLLAAFMLRRRRQISAEPTINAAPIAASKTDAEATPRPAPVPPRAEPSSAKPPAPRPAPTPTTLPPPPLTPDENAPLTLHFTPTNLRLSLVYATVQGRLDITAHQQWPASILVGDVIGAHGSIPPEQQLAPAPSDLPRLKTVPPLSAGESTSVAFEVQIPLNSISRVQQGKAALFVPLVRLCLLADHGDALRRIYTLGTDTGGSALMPFRLDDGPLECKTVQAREVEAARQYPVLTLQKAV